MIAMSQGIESYYQETIVLEIWDVTNTILATIY